MSCLTLLNILFAYQDRYHPASHVRSVRFNYLPLERGSLVFDQSWSSKGCGGAQDGDVVLLVGSLTTFSLSMLNEGERAAHPVGIERYVVV